MPGPILLLAGFLQLVAGRLKLGCWFRVTAPAVVHGMLTGIGVLIVLSQVLDRPPRWTACTAASVPLNNLSYIDHSCLELLEEWGRANAAKGSTLLIEARGLKRRLEGRLRTITGMGSAI